MARPDGRLGRPGVLRLRLPGASRGSLGVVDQVLSSGSNLGITVVAARALDRTSFGGFALALVVYMFALGGSRSLVTEPLLVRARTATAEDVSGALGATVCFGVTAGLLCALAGGVAGGAVGHGLVPLGVLLPLILLQDGLRYVAFSLERPSGALLVDGVWVVAEVVAVAVLIVAGSRDAGAFVLVWGLAAAIAAVIGCASTRTVPGFATAGPWVRRNVDLGVPFLLEFLASGGAAYAVLWVLGALTDIAAVGAVRLASTVFGPINVFYAGIYLIVVPAGARYAVTDRRQLRHVMAWVSAVSCGLTAACTVVAISLPGGVGNLLFGASWTNARRLLLPLGIGTCAGGVAAGATAGLRSLAAARRGLRTRVATLPLAIILPLAGSLAGDAMGYSIGWAAASWVAAMMWWRAFGRALRSAEARGVAAPPAGGRRLPPAGTTSPAGSPWIAGS